MHALFFTSTITIIFALILLDCCGRPLWYHVSNQPNPCKDGKCHLHKTGNIFFKLPCAYELTKYRFEIICYLLAHIINRIFTTTVVPTF